MKRNATNNNSTSAKRRAKETVQEPVVGKGKSTVAGRELEIDAILPSQKDEDDGKVAAEDGLGRADLIISGQESKTTLESSKGYYNPKKYFECGQRLYFFEDPRDNSEDENYIMPDIFLTEL